MASLDDEPATQRAHLAGELAPTWPFRQELNSNILAGEEPDALAKDFQYHASRAVGRLIPTECEAYGLAMLDHERIGDIVTL